MEKTQTIGDYTIERVLGTDGMSRTYLSTRQHTSEKVVIKVMTLKNPLMTERFVTEAKQVQNIHHPNLVRVVDVGKDASTESPYIVMENVERHGQGEGGDGRHGQGDYCDGSHGQCGARYYGISKS